MKALRLHAARQLAVHEEPEPVPGPGEVRLRVTAVGLCGSDRHWFLDGGIGGTSVDRPLVLGHEFAGVIESGPRTGERVAGDPAVPCRRCERCRAGEGHLCLDLPFAGHSTTDGALREVMAWPGAELHPLPDAVSDAEGALAEALGIALHGLDLGVVGPGATASVHGCGPIGLLLVQLLRMVACRTIVAIDPLAHRVAAAEAMGATNVLPAADPLQDEAAIEALTDGRGVDVAFESAGEDAALESAVRAARSGGRVVLVGIPADERSSFPAAVARRKELSLRLSRRMQASDLPRAIELIASGRVAVAPLITERYPISESAAAFASLADRRGLKVVVEPSRASAVAGAS